MLKPHEVKRVKHLAENGLSRRAISMKTGFARATVQKILDGGYRSSDTACGDDEDAPLWSGPIGRCPTCGGRVYLPCVACRVREFRAAEAPAPLEPLPLAALAGRIEPRRRAAARQRLGEPGQRRCA